MTTELEYLSQNLYCLCVYLLEPIISINGAAKLLITNAPQLAYKSLADINSISGDIQSEIYLLPRTSIDLQTPDNAANQLSSLASKWGKDTENLFFHIKNVQSMESQFKEKDKILLKIIHNKLENLQGYIQLIKLIKVNHLIQDDGITKYLHLEIPK